MAYPFLSAVHAVCPGRYPLALPYHTSVVAMLGSATVCLLWISIALLTKLYHDKFLYSFIQRNLWLVHLLFPQCSWICGIFFWSIDHRTWTWYMMNDMRNYYTTGINKSKKYYEWQFHLESPPKTKLAILLFSIKYMYTYRIIFYCTLWFPKE